MNWLRFGWPRRYISGLAIRIWGLSRTPEWFLDWLYPTDALVTFAERPDEPEAQTKSVVAKEAAKTPYEKWRDSGAGGTWMQL